jgi:hypothetical protein
MNKDGTILSFANFCTPILLLIQKHNKKASERERKKEKVPPKRKKRCRCREGWQGCAMPDFVFGFVFLQIVARLRHAVICQGSMFFRPSGLNLSVETRLRHAKVLRRLRMIISTELRSLFS